MSHAPEGQRPAPQGLGDKEDTMIEAKKRIYIRAPWPESGIFDLDSSITHYLKNVLRISEQIIIEIFDGSGTSLLAQVTPNKSRTWQAQVCSELLQHRKPSHDIELAQGICKTTSMDLIIQKATELGVTTITPILADHASHASHAQLLRRHDHWVKVTIAAACQCGRNYLPSINSPVTLAKHLASGYSKQAKAYWFTPGATTNFIPTSQQNVTLFVGPEGGFSEEENLGLQNVAGQPYNLGDNILKAETAAIASLAITLLTNR